MTKLCCDCKHYRRSWLEHIFLRTDSYDRCMRPDPSIVSGQTNGHFCDVERKEWKFFNLSGVIEQRDTCGPDAKYFEAL